MTSNLTIWSVFQNQVTYITIVMSMFHKHNRLRATLQASAYPNYVVTVLLEYV